jgi:hypothetical protein
MSRLIQSVVVIFSLLFFMSAQASVNVVMPVKECAIFAGETADDGVVDETKKEDGEATTGEDGEEEEPECD